MPFYYFLMFKFVFYIHYDHNIFQMVNTHWRMLHSCADPEGWMENHIVVWVSIEISIWTPPPPWKKLDPVENVGTPLDPWKSMVFSVIKPLDPSVNCKIS